jgi:hypothetical protein
MVPRSRPSEVILPRRERARGRQGQKEIEIQGRRGRKINASLTRSMSMGLVAHLQRRHLKGEGEKRVASADERDHRCRQGIGQGSRGNRGRCRSGKRRQLRRIPWSPVLHVMLTLQCETRTYRQKSNDLPGERHLSRHALCFIARWDIDFA